MEKVKTKSRTKQFVILAVVAALIVVLFKVLLGGNTFNIQSNTDSYESPVKSRSDRVTDSRGHTNDFWTDSRFKW